MQTHEIRALGAFTTANQRVFHLTKKEHIYIDNCLDLMAGMYPDQIQDILFYRPTGQAVGGPIIDSSSRFLELGIEVEGYVVYRVGSSNSLSLPLFSRAIALPAPENSNVGIESQRPSRGSSFAKRLLKQYMPNTYDRARHYRHSRLLALPTPRFAPTASSHQSISARGTPDCFESKRLSNVVLLGIHWFDVGGAEAWALESAKVWSKQGYQVVVVSAIPGRSALFSHFADVSSLALPLGDVLSRAEMDSWLMRFLSSWEPSIVHIHHNWHIYDSLPMIRAASPNTRVYDSTHIVEPFDGGFVGKSLKYSNFIDEHHVISPALEETYVEALPHDSRPKIRIGQLAQLSASSDSVEDVCPSVDSGTAASITHRPHEELIIGFLGRFEPQKRPEVFVALGRRLERKAKFGLGPSFRFIMQGSGSLTRQTLSRATRLGDQFQHRDWGSVDAFYREVDILVMPSANEGLALVAMDAVRAGVPVLSTDVGSQKSICGSAGVLPVERARFIRKADRLLTSYVNDRRKLVALWESQRENLRKIEELPTALQVVADWARKDAKRKRIRNE